MIGERVIVTNSESECFNQEFTVTSNPKDLNRCDKCTSWGLSDDRDTIYIHKDSFELVKNMVIKVIDGMPYLVTQKEAGMIDAIISRKTRPVLT